jgi:DNA-binding transcriptional regulator YiaG
VDTHLDPIQLAKAYAFLRSGIAPLVRKDSGLPLSAIARPLGVRESTVWRWETSARMPRPEAAIAYVALLRELMQASRGVD